MDVKCPPTKRGSRIERRRKHREIADGLCRTRTRRWRLSRSSTRKNDPRHAAYRVPDLPQENGTAMARARPRASRPAVFRARSRARGSHEHDGGDLGGRRPTSAQDGARVADRCYRSPRRSDPILPATRGTGYAPRGTRRWLPHMREPANDRTKPSSGYWLGPTWDAKIAAATSREPAKDRTKPSSGY
jgi:hypothetical protein